MISTDTALKPRPTMTLSLGDARRLYESGKGLMHVAKIAGTNYSALRRLFLESGIPIRSTGEAARLQGPTRRERALGHKRGPMSAESRQKMSLAKLGKGRGWRVTASGYIEFTMGPNKGRLQHNVVMEQRIGRRIARGEVVHHRDENKQNNDPSNLELMTRSEHTSHHRRERTKRGH